MYKRITLDELMGMQTTFFQRLWALQSKQWHASFKQFMRELHKDSNRVYFFERNAPQLRITFTWTGDDCIIVDDQEHIDIVCTDQDMTAIHNLLKNTQKMKTIQNSDSLMDTLMLSYGSGNHRTIAGKPYLVYDIETTFWWEISGQYFEMAYSIDSAKAWEEWRYIDRDNMKKYADYLLEYDGWIIGYNNFSFDNPVLMKNVGYGTKEIEAINAKSLDPFLLFWTLTGRRISLNNVAQWLINAWKTLASWAEWADLLKKYKETWSEKALQKVKEYCKNDVRITLGVVLYLLEYQHIQFEWEQFQVTPETFIKQWVPKAKQRDEDVKAASTSWWKF